MKVSGHLVLASKVDMININLLSLSEIMKYLSLRIRYPVALFLLEPFSNGNIYTLEKPENGTGHAINKKCYKAHPHCKGQYRHN